LQPSAASASSNPFRSLNVQFMADFPRNPLREQSQHDQPLKRQILPVDIRRKNM
jgi:hypothetical protein